MFKKIILSICLLLISTAAHAVLLVSSFNPVADSEGVSVSPTITINFSPGYSGIDCSTTVNNGNPRIFVSNSKGSKVGATTISCVDGDSSVQLSVTGLSAGTWYYVTIDRNVKMKDGKYVTTGSTTRGSNNWTGNTFKTTSNITPPTVIDSYPLNNALNIPVTTSVTVTFDLVMDETTLGYASNGNIKLLSGSTSGTFVPGTASYDDESGDLSITPSTKLIGGTVYYLVVSSDVTNTSGIKMGANYVLKFTTLPVDTTKPTIVSKNPSGGATNVPLTSPLNITFSEPMDVASVTTGANIYLKKGVTSVDGVLSYVGSSNTAVFTPATSLTGNTKYTLTVIGPTSGVKDVSGNYKDKNESWDFTTAGSNTITSAALNQYCQLPPFITSGANSLKPNVLLLVDNSGSMAEFAYKAAGKGNSTSSRDTSYLSKNDYYGLFDYTKMYKYNSSGYFEIDTTSSPDRTSQWSGNLLNWATTRKVDLVKKVLVGGQTQPVGSTPTGRTQTTFYLYPYNDSDRDFYKSYGGLYYNVDSTLVVCKDSACKTKSTYNLKILHGSTEPTGLLQSSSDRVNFGIELFNYGTKFENNTYKDGGYIKANIGSNLSTLVSAIESSDADPQTWTPLAEAFYEATRYFRKQTSAYNSSVSYSSVDPITANCMKNFIIIMTDGQSTKDRNLPNSSFTGTKVTEASTNLAKLPFDVKPWINFIGTKESLANLYTLDLGSEGSWYLPAVAFWAHTTDLRTDKSGLQNITTYVVYTLDDDAIARNILVKTAKYGGFDNPDISADNVTVGGYWPSLTNMWDKNGDTVPDTYFEAQNGQELVEALANTINDIISKVSSGTSASIVNNRGESGSNLFQAVFYPKKSIGNAELYWTGEMQNMWYYIDPLIETSSIREDTDINRKLDLKADDMVTVDFDVNTNQTLATWYKDTTGKGSFSLDTDKPQGSPDGISALWRSGGMLHRRAPSTRTIYSTIASLNYNTKVVSEGNSGFTNFLDSNSDKFLNYMNLSDEATASKVINYIRGVDYPTDSTYRSRTTTIKYPNTNHAPLNTTVSGTWKLGDIVSSTPQAQTQKQLQSYDASYKDSSYSMFYNSTNYKNRNMVYTAANDGMLHAFRIGKVARTPYSASTPYTLASIANTPVDSNDELDIGDEEWAFIPQNVLPYLKYYGDPGYNHLYYVNNTVTLLDVSMNKPTSDTNIACTKETYWNCTKKTAFTNATDNVLDADNTSWRTVLIGAMGLGGASRDYSGFCNKPDGTTPTNQSQETRLDCVKSPIPGAGVSSFFALDVTEPRSPRFLWEFSDAVLPTADKGLGYSVSGPAIVRMSAKKNAAATTGQADTSKNGRWLAVFATGPSGPIDVTNHQFMGRSDNNLKVYVVDMNPDIASSGWVKNKNYWVFDSGLKNSFAGDMTDVVVDVDRSNSSSESYYSDDVVYIGYTSPDNPTAPTAWTNGGVLRLLTNNSTDPAKWSLSKLIENVGPVTSSPTKLQDKKSGKLWVYFGTGRYFYKNNSGVDDPTNQRYLIGVADTCYDGQSNTMNSGYKSDGITAYGCAATAPTPLTLASLKDKSNEASLAALDFTKNTEKGWKIALDLSGNYSMGANMQEASYDAERVVTNTSANFNGTVFFTSFKPTSDICGYGGSTLVWIVDYATGGAPPASTLKGKLIVQLSSGEFLSLNLATATKSGGDSTQVTRGDRRLKASLAGHGIAGSKGGSLQSMSQPVRKILHVMEK